MSGMWPALFGLAEPSMFGGVLAGSGLVAWCLTCAGNDPSSLLTAGAAAPAAAAGDPGGGGSRGEPNARDLIEGTATDLGLGSALDIAAGRGGLGRLAGGLGAAATVVSGSEVLANGIRNVAASEGRGLGGGSQNARDVAEYMPGARPASGDGGQEGQ